ncbi:hypothetical protein DID75_04575 [Candidatus Marinamargulisbacteria bacterium SCGC AG-410-N11]|nr:hypothetical protein DID75_04575 [Candidatus Marinamargulisbacteria bacterium SCGC AG-410-N11]
MKYLPDKFNYLLFFGCLFIFTFVFYVIKSVLGNEWILLDNSVYILQNPYIQSFSWDSIKTLLLGYIYWMPLTWLSHFFDYYIYGTQHAGHLLTNVVLHCLNSVMFFLVMLLVMSPVSVKYFFSSSLVDKWDDFFSNRGYWFFMTVILVTCLWAVHPLKMESVAWVADRKGLLMAFFSFLGCYYYLKWTLSSYTYQKWFVWSQIWCVCALASKPTAVVLPLIYLLIDVLYSRWEHDFDSTVNYSTKLISFGRRFFRYSCEKWVLWLVVAMVVVITVNEHFLSQSFRTMDQYTLENRLAGSFYHLLFYLKKLMVPSQLVSYYPFKKITFDSMISWLSCLVVLLMTGLSLFWIRYRPYFSVTWLFYLILMLPMLGLFQVGNQLVANRWTYFSVCSFFVLLCGCLIWMMIQSERVQRWRVFICNGLLVGLCSLLFIFSVQSYIQLSYWQTRFTFWDRVIDVYPNQVPAAYNTLGYLVERQGNLMRAEEYYKQSLSVSDTYYRSYLNLGRLSLKRSDIELANTYFNQVVKLVPNDFSGYLNLGLVARSQRDFKKTLEYFLLAYEKASIYSSRNVELLFELQVFIGYAYHKLNDYENALTYLNKAYKYNDQHADLLILLSDVYYDLYLTSDNMQYLYQSRDILQINVKPYVFSKARLDNQLKKLIEK